jgi:hypothetical protein
MPASPSTAMVANEILIIDPGTREIVEIFQDLAGGYGRLKMVVPNAFSGNTYRLRTIAPARPAG